MSGPKKELSDDENRDLLEALRKIDPVELERVRESLGDVAEMLEEMVNGFPAARKFLRSRGASRVADLAPAELKELEDFIVREWFGKKPN